MPSQKLISGKIDPDDDIRRRLYSAPINLAHYYLIAAIAQSRHQQARLGAIFRVAA